MVSFSWGSRAVLPTVPEAAAKISVRPPTRPQYISRIRMHRDTVPSVGVSRDFLWRERELCYQSQTTPDCRTRCSGCGANKLLTGGGRCG